MQEFWLTIKKNVCLASTGAEKAQEKKKKYGSKTRSCCLGLSYPFKPKKKKKVKASFLTNQNRGYTGPNEFRLGLNMTHCMQNVEQNKAKKPNKKKAEKKGEKGETLYVQYRTD